MEQTVRFCTAQDGVRIAYATIGTGPPLVKAANWLNHLEYDWQSPVWRHWLMELARSHTLIRYDERGCGLSDWQVDDFSLEAWVSDLETVVEAFGLEKFPLLGISQGGPVAISYATRHPEKVSQLILYGAYAQGWKKRNFSKAETDQHRALNNLIKVGWGHDNPAFRQVFSMLFMPDATAEQLHWFTELERVSTSPENAARFYEAFGVIDVLDLLPKISVPTLVLHVRDDTRVPVEAGRQLAAMIPGARFVLLEGKNHILLENEPAWSRFLSEVRRFLGVKLSDATPRSFIQTYSLGAVQAQAAKLSTLPTFTNVDDLSGQNLAHYQILEKIGDGGMGVVYKARDLRLDRLVALKFLPAHLSLEEEAKQRFLREAQAASALDHPNICTIYDIGQLNSGQYFIAMPCYDGETLKQKIANGPLPLPDILDYSLQAAEGLACAHAAGILHRDIKPANVMVTREGRVKLLDFGLAKTVGADFTKSGFVMGTVAYMSPEQARGEKVDARTDLWSLGVLMYEMLTGERPFKGEHEQVVLFNILNQNPPPVKSLRKDVPQKLAEVVERLLQKEMVKRYQNAGEVVTVLQGTSM